MVFAVTLVRGPNWDLKRPMREQDGWEAHAHFMDDLAARGVVALGGPLEDDSRLLVVRAPDAAGARAALEPDPWHVAGLLEIVNIRRWTVLLASSRLEDWQ